MEKAIIIIEPRANGTSHRAREISFIQKKRLPPLMMSQIIQDQKGYIAIYEQRYAKKSIWWFFWCAWSKFDRGKKMTKSAHTIGISNTIYNQKLVPT